MHSAFRIVERNALILRRTWRAELITMIGPFFYLSAIGMGVGSLVDRQSDGIDGVGYLQFLAPGLMAASAMQTAANDNAWPIMGKIRWERVYHAMLATPLRTGDLVLGEVLWTMLRLLKVTGIFFAAMVLFGAVPAFWGLLAVPAVILTGLAFGAPIAALSATLRTPASYRLLFGLVITPLFLFSGTFVPIDRLPAPLQLVAWATPLFHGVSLTRSLALGTARPGSAAGHLAVLLIFVLAGIVAARFAFRRALTP